MLTFDPRDPKVAFQPPSDMGPSGGSSKSKKIFVGLGIGCGVVLIFVGILFAAGAFKAISCCNDVKNVANASMGAEAAGGDFADEIYRGEVDAAYARTSEEFQKGTSLDAFESAVEAHRERMKSNRPRLFNMQLEQHGGDNPSLENLSKGAWLLSYQFAGPQDTSMLLLNFRVLSAGEGGVQKIEDVRFEDRARNLDMEPPAIEVSKVHELIQKGQYELAYTRLGDGFRSNSNMDAWKAFLKDAGPAVTSSTLSVREVDYNETNTQATVMAHAQTADGKNAIVQYELTAMQPELPGAGWRVVAIAPLVAQSNDVQVDPAPEVDGEEPTDAIEGGTNGAEPSIMPPDVKVDVPG